LIYYIIIVIDRILVANIYKAHQIIVYFITNIEVSNGRDWVMQVASGTLYATQQSIIAKLSAMGATSREKAVTPQEAHLDMQEINWLSYVAGGLFAMVKKTKDKRYYLATYYQT
jgi:hypothetical protein